MIFELIAKFVPVFIAIILHEVAHGYVALKLGDDTAKKYGRLTINPISHIDWFGSVFMPFTLWWAGAPFLFGWAKPVPVNFRKLRNQKRDTVIVASAGIVVNALLALSVFAIYILFTPEYPEFLINFFWINIALIFLNILPIPPLDGSKIFFGWIDRPWAQKYVLAEREGMIAIIILIVLIPVVERMFGLGTGEMFDPLGWYMNKMFSWVLKLMMLGA